MKTANLKSLTTIFEYYKKEDPDIKCLKFWNREIKSTDLESLNILLQNIYENEPGINISNFNDFYIGYTIPQIGKEFDLLRFTDKSILNIELKRQITSKIRYQLIKNKYYLKFFNKNLFFYTYAARERKLFKLNEDNELLEVDLHELIDIIKSQVDENIINQNIDDLFIPSNYLISPFSKTEEFLNNEYFLTKEQEEIEQDILTRIQNNEKAFLVTGGAGSGKTLLVYHLAKNFKANSKKVALIHMGNLNPGHEKLKEEFSWNIQPIKFWSLIFKDNIPEIIIIDEVQRANNKKQFEDIISKIKEKQIILIMSGDKNQTLRKEEGWAIEWTNINKYKLNEKIRTNKVLASFITVLLDLKRKHHIETSSKNIDIIYFENLEEAKQYILNKKNYTYISYTPNTGNYGNLCEMHRLNFAKSNTAHQVIGQEFENVITVLDKNFYYDENERLWANKVTYNPYSLRKMFFQQITRAINKLEIVVIENIELYRKIVSIFE